MRQYYRTEYKGLLPNGDVWLKTYDPSAVLQVHSRKPELTWQCHREWIICDDWEPIDPSEVRSYD